MTRLAILLLAMTACAAPEPCVRTVDADAMARLCGVCHAAHWDVDLTPYRHQCQPCHTDSALTWTAHETRQLGFLKTYVTKDCP